MDARTINSGLSVSPQITAEDVKTAKDHGFRAIICNRPDGEGMDQPNFEEIETAAEALGLEVRYLPIVAGKVQDEDAEAFGKLLEELPGPVLAYCRTGTRSATLWSLAVAKTKPVADILAATQAAGYDMGGVVRRIANGGKTPTDRADAQFDVVIVGGGAAGIAVAASLKARKPNLDMAIIDPAAIHYYQPGWTMVGGGIFEAPKTAKTMGSLIPAGVHWIKSAVAAFEPKDNAVILDGCRVVKYRRLIVAPGLKLDWNRVEGLVDTLGQNGVTSNYRYDLAPYTWELVKGMKTGRAVFTPPPMPIKCAGAPQKALYLSGDHWHREGVLDKIDIQFMNAGGVLFGVKDYVPALQGY
ncbi:MAG: TIGR01244 family sulfur transferase, partial [Roseicyclus sp.]|nr:TIGR01244 family sulfur transferase [Roseicyclus sp.]